MKKVILSVLFLGLFTSAAWLILMLQQKKQKHEKEAARAESIPYVNLTSLSGDTFPINKLSKNIASVLIYYNSTCEICQVELKSFSDRISEFVDANIFLVSSQEQEEISKFYSTHPLKNHPKVFWLVDDKMEVASYYGVRSVPAIFCYDAFGKLQGKFKGPIKVDIILDRLGISKKSNQ